MMAAEGSLSQNICFMPTYFVVLNNYHSSVQSTWQWSGILLKGAYQVQKSRFFANNNV